MRSKDPLSPYRFGAWLPDGKQIVVATSYEVTVLSSDLTPGSESLSRKRGEFNTWQVTCLACSLNGRIATGWNDGSVLVGTSEALSESERILGPGPQVLALAYCPDSAELAIGLAAAGEVHILYPEKRRAEVRVRYPGMTGVRSLNWIPGKGRLVIGADFGMLDIWDPKSSRSDTLRLLKQYSIDCVAVSPDSAKVFVSGSPARIIDLGSGKTLKVLTTTVHVESAVWSPDGKLLFGVREDGKVWAWDTKDWKGKAVRGISEALWIALSPDGQRLVFGDGTGNLDVREVSLR